LLDYEFVGNFLYRWNDYVNNQFVHSCRIVLLFKRSIAFISYTFKTLVNIIKIWKPACIRCVEHCSNSDAPYEHFKEMSTNVIAFADGLIFGWNVRVLCTTLEFYARTIITVHLFYILTAIVRGRTFTAKRIRRVSRVCEHV